MSTLPLEGIRIADFSWIHAGPQNTMWLAVMGAEVIKIESRQRTDLMRQYARAWSEERGGNINTSPIFAVLNYSKKSCTLNLSQPKGVEIAKEIVKRSDVVVESFGTGVMERFGLDYSDLKQIKPDIIMLSVAGFGSTGKYGVYRGNAPTTHAYSGLCSITGYLGDSANLMGAMWADHEAALMGAFAILSALHHRNNTGEGQYIDLSMTEVAISTIPEAVMDYTMNQHVREPMGNRDDIMAPHGCYRCKGEDKWVTVACSNDEEWHALIGAMGNPEWGNDERFADSYRRWMNQRELDEMVEQWTVERTPHEVMDILQAAGVAAGPSLNAAELLHDPHLLERGFLAEFNHPEMGTGMLPRLPWIVNNTPTGHYKPAPLFGEDNDYVFRELLGMNEDEIDQLIQEKAIY